MSRTDFGKRWPLTVEAGVVSCEAPGSVVFMDPEGTLYAVIGEAMSRFPDLPRINRIWAPDPEDPVLKIDISPVLDRGLELC